MTQGARRRSKLVRRRSVAALLALGVSGVAVGCLSPTLPLPPPSRPEVFSPDEDGNVRVRGVVQSRAIVFVLNQRTDQVVGEVTGSDGAYDLLIQAEVGDRLGVWQSVDTKESDSVEVLVPAETTISGTPPPPDELGGASGE